MALEGEWEKFAIPFFLLAGAEAIYASLGHVHDALVARNLIGLYQRISKDLNLVRETLCDPFLVAAEEETFAPALAMYCERAASLATSLDAISVITQSRCQLIQYHITLWDTSNPKFGDLSRLFNDMLPNLPREGARAMPMVTALEREVQGWKYLMETAYSLERCRYVPMKDTVVLLYRHSVL
jgi:hypothetical protein